MFKVFICYAREDSKSAMRLYYDLKKSDLDPWIDKKSLKGGQNWKASH